MQKKSGKPIAAKPIIVDSPPIKKKWLYLFLGLFAIALYANTLGHEYTIDDGTVINNNKFTKEGFQGLGKIFASPYRAGYWDRQEGLYRPLSTAMFAIEWQLGGGSPFTGHLVNILLYALTGIILYRVLFRLLKEQNALIALIATLIFIAHPVHTEVVANIKSRDEILAFLLGITALHFLFRYLDTSKIIFIAAALLSYLLALFSKENSITWIGIFPLALWCDGKTNLKKNFLLSLPFVLAAGIFLLIRMKVLGSISGKYELLLINNSLVGTASKVDQVATAILILGKYLWLLIFPLKLVFDYSYNSIPLVTAGSIEALVPLLIYAGGLIYALMKLRERSMISFGILFFLITISLVSNVFFLIEATMAERFLYTPSLGFCLLTALLGQKLLKAEKKKLSFSMLRRNRKLVYPVVIILLLFSVRTIARNFDWKDNLTLLQKDVKSSPESARIQFAIGSSILLEQATKEEDEFKKNKYLDAAIGHLEKGVRLIPNFNDAWYHLGLAYKEKGDFTNAVRAFDESRSYRAFTDAERLVSAGVAYGAAGQYDKALTDLKLATTIDSNSTDALNNYGLYLSDVGRIDESLAALTKAIQKKPDFSKAYYNRGNTWAKAQNYPNAIKDYKKAIEINSKYSDAYNNIGNCFAVMQLPDSSRVWFEKSIEINPDNVKALINLSYTCRSLNDTAAANRYLERANLLQSGH